MSVIDLVALELSLHQVEPRANHRADEVGVVASRGVVLVDGLDREALG